MTRHLDGCYNISAMDNKKATRRDFVQKSLAAATGIAATGSTFYLSLLKATTTFAQTENEQNNLQKNSLFLSKLQDEVDPLNKKALWAGPFKGGGEGDKYGGVMEEPHAKKK